jgi:hypothetical protein
LRPASARAVLIGIVVSGAAKPSSPLKFAIVAYFNLAKCEAKLRTARKITTYVFILGLHPCDHAAR